MLDQAMAVLHEKQTMVMYKTYDRLESHLRIV